MPDFLELRLRELFQEEAQKAPAARGLAHAVRTRARRRQAVVASTVAAFGALAVGLAFADPFPHAPGGRTTGTPPRPLLSTTYPSVSPTHLARRGALPVTGEMSCVQAYSSANLVQRSFAYDGTVTNVGPLPGASQASGPSAPRLVEVTFTVHEWFRGGHSTTVTVEMSPPTRAGQDSTAEAFESYTKGVRLLVSGEPQWPDHPADHWIAWGCGFTRYYDEPTAASWRVAFRR